MKNRILLLCAMIMSLSLWSCSDDDDMAPGKEKPAVEKTVAVVLPMENGLDLHWQRIFTLLQYNTAQAFSDCDKTVRLNIEYYDEGS